MARPAKAEIDLSALRANLSLVKKLAPRSKVVSVVKANAYGHGSIEIARAISTSTDMMTVSCLEEAQVLREAGVTTPILLLEGLFARSELEQAAKLDLQLVVHELQQIDFLDHFSDFHAFVIWLKLDTGMHRLGICPDDAGLAMTKLARLDCVAEVRLMSHFACADQIDSVMNNQQLRCLHQQYQNLQARGHNQLQLSMANSAGILAWPDAHLDWVRPGIMLYGVSPFAVDNEQAKLLKPVMSLKSKVIGMRDVKPNEAVGYGATWRAQGHAKIATVAIGYGDGYPRNAKSGTPVLVNGQRAKLAGRVSMDLIGVDVTGLENVHLGSEVTLWGEALPANEVAGWADTIGYELVTRMPTRVPRVYL